MNNNQELQTHSVSIGASRGQLADPPRLPSSDGVFATIRLANDAGLESVNYLGQSYYSLSYHNRRRLNIGRTGVSVSMHFNILWLS